MAAEMFSDIFFLGDLLDPDVCTRRMGMTPSKAYRKGQRHGPLVRTKKTGGWWWSTSRRMCDDISLENERCFAGIASHAAAIAELKAEYNLRLCMCAVVEMSALPYPRLFWPDVFFKTAVSLQVDDYSVDWYDLAFDENVFHDPVETRARSWMVFGEGEGVVNGTGWHAATLLEEPMLKCLDAATGEMLNERCATMHVEVEVHNDERLVLGFSRSTMERMKSLGFGLEVHWKRM